MQRIRRFKILHLGILLSVFVVFVFFVFNYLNSSVNLTSKASSFVRCILFERYDTICFRKNDDIYISTRDIEEVFDLNGNFDSLSNEYRLSVFKFNDKNKLTDNYMEPLREFLDFDHINVEMRNKVLLICPDEGVPISKQWYKYGHKYPIQIAQYGLSHFSKYMRLKRNSEEIKIINIYDHISKISSQLSQPSKDRFIRLSEKSLSFTTLLNLPHFKHDNENEQFVIPTAIKLNSETAPTLIEQFNLASSQQLNDFYLIGSKWSLNTAFYLSVRFKSMKENVAGLVYDLFYVCSNGKSQKFGKKIFYFIQQCDRIKLIRNIRFDIAKVITDIKEKKMVLEMPRVLFEIGLIGQGNIELLQFSNSFSFDKFLHVADWFVNRQVKETGGWPTRVIRRISNEIQLEPGWYSAMAQGHAMSLLSRAYNVTGKKDYLKAAIKAVKLFSKNSDNGNGIRAYFMNITDLVWFEEYPTTPPLFVLNGFIYSLMGLYDLCQLQGHFSSHFNNSIPACFHLSEGLKSLRNLLPLFDSGSGSFYDLRHITFNNAYIRLNKKTIRNWEVPDGPNRARPEYHYLHVKQLNYLGKVTKIVEFSQVSRRFNKYLLGYRSSRN